MPKQFLMGRSSLVSGFVHVIELSHWEIFKLMLGREIKTITAEGETVIRCGIAYSAFNLGASAATLKKAP